MAERSKYIVSRADVAKNLPQDVIVKTPFKVGISTAGKTLSKISGYTNIAGGAAGYYGAVENAVNKDYLGFATEGTGNTASILLAAKNSNAAGLAWTFGWEGGRLMSTTEVYNKVLFGVHSQIYKQRGIENGWYIPYTLRE